VSWALAAAEALIDGPVEVAVVGRRDDPSRAAMLEAVARSRRPGLVAVAGEPDDAAHAAVPLLRERPAVDGVATSYVCRGFVCERPTTDVDELAGQLGGRSLSRPGRRHPAP
jgi:uncharacterized protein YyaL (SSP411 family)